MSKKRIRERLSQPSSNPSDLYASSPVLSMPRSSPPPGMGLLDADDALSDDVIEEAIADEPDGEELINSDMER